MKKVLWAIPFVGMLLTALPVHAQNPNYDVGPVWIVNYYHIKARSGRRVLERFPRECETCV